MNRLQLQDNSIYRHLQSVFHEQGYYEIPAKNMFRKKTKKGFRSVLFSISRETGNQFLDIHFGLRFDLVETLVQQFLHEKAKAEEHESNTILLSLHHLKTSPVERSIINDKPALLAACSKISVFMEEKGFRFLRAHDRLKRIDATINRKPNLPCVYMQNQVHRCFKGIIIARLLQRNDFEMLTTIYANYLYSQCGPPHILENYNRLVNYRSGRKIFSSDLFYF